jgi:hypothetical protein
MKGGLWFAATLLMTSSVARAQSTTGTIVGRVLDAQRLPVAGVRVNAESTSLQGIRTAVTSANGDYIIALLPSGMYKLTFQPSDLPRIERTVTLAPTQVLPVEVVMGRTVATEPTGVVGRSANVLTQTAQVAINISQDLVATLPTTPDINAALLLAPAVHPTGPNGNYSMAGSVSSENLFLIDGVTFDEDHRGQTNDQYIGDAIQETTVATGGISAEIGRFTGGVVNVVTKSGGNLFSGSVRSTLNNDNWRELTTFEKAALARPGGVDNRLNAVVPTYEFTFGGPLMKDRLWFFTAGHLQREREGRQLVATLVPYEFTRETGHYGLKGTYSATSSHRFQAAYTNIADKEINIGQAASMDLRSLENDETPQELFTASYSGILAANFSLEGRYSQRKLTLIRSGTKTTDLIDGTLMIDDARGLRYWSPTSCGVCMPEKLENTDIFVKGSYFRSTRGAGSHALVFGYDNFDDIRQTNNHQSGSDYRILGTGTIVQSTGTSAIIYPVLLGSNNTTRIQWNPVPLNGQGLNFRTHAVFFTDSWRMSSRVTATLGVRWDKNDGRDQQGNLTAKDGAISPRLGVVWDPLGDQRWSITGSFAKYVTSIATRIADSASAAGNPQSYLYFYQGPDINANAAGSLTSTPDAIRQVFAWFNANGGVSRPLSEAPTVPGVSPQIRESLDSPNALEYAAGVNRQFGNHAALRVDYVYRDYRDFYASKTDTTTGKVANSLGNPFDLTLIVNSNVPQRQYQAMNAQATYRLGSHVDIGGTYTLSRTWGNFEGENVTSGPLAANVLQHPEYKQASWNYPEGDLQIDQRHRARLWASYGLTWVNGLTISLLQTLESGVPYGASNINNTSANGIDSRPWVTNPGYLTPPTGANTLYFYTARDAFRTEGQKRTDFAVNYVRRLGTGSRPVNLFIQAQIINLFGNEQLCACGGTVFENGGGVAQTRIDQTVRTSVNRPTLYLPFDPFTTKPVQSVNWEYGPNFGQALNRFAYTSPRQFRISFGVRF